MKTSVKRLWRMFLLLGIVIVSTACIPFVGDRESEETPTPDVIPTVIRPTQAATPAPAPPASPVPTLIPLTTPQPSTAATAPPACTPRTDWPLYTIQSGDTLYSLAIRTDTTVDTLQAANCLADPHTIREGQELRVPTLPSPPSPAATAQPAATQPPFFQGTPTATTGDVTFIFVIANSSATEIDTRAYRARTSDGIVYLSIVANNAASFRVLRADGQQLGSGAARQGSANAGNTVTFNKSDIFEGSDSLIFTVEATKRDDTVTKSLPVYISWP